MPRVPPPEQLELGSTREESRPQRSRAGTGSSGRRQVVSGAPKRSSQKAGSQKPGFPRLALTFAESAAMLGVSDEFFGRYVAHEVRFVRRGRKKLVAVRELERWLEESAAREVR
ncbi:MAG: helix-turn-helix domain-containing protein [Gaiellaceae bacterium]